MDFTNPIAAVVPSLEGRILIVLARAAQPLSGSRVADLVPEASNSGVRIALRRMVEQGVVLAQPSSHAILYSANRQHLAWSAIEAVVDYATNADTALRERIAALADTELSERDRSRTTIALYGSVARGQARPDSDIDLVVLAPDDAEPAAVERLVLALTAGVPRWTGNLCSVYDLTHSRLRELIDAGDPIVPSWKDDAITLTGPNLDDLLTGSTR
jgi:predicted nucleotidyltransferase